MTSPRRRGWLLGALGTIGVGSILYALTTNTLAAAPDAPPTMLVWPLLGVVPMLGLGLWFAAASDSPMGVYLLLGGTGMAVSSAYETAVAAHPQVLAHPAFALLNIVGLSADALSTIGGALAIATFPDGTVQRPWQRRVLRLVWLDLLVGPLSVLVSPDVATSPWLDLGPITNPYAVESLVRVEPVVRVVLLEPWATIGLGALVFASRALLGDEQTRRRLRFMAAAVVGAAAAFGLWLGGTALGAPAGGVVMITTQAAVYVGMLAIPVAFIHGLLRPDVLGTGLARATVAVRSSWLLITVLYACAVAAPALLLVGHLSVVVAVVLTVALALLLHPVRARAEAWVRRRALGDPDQQFAVLTALGARLEQTVGFDDVLRELGEAIRDGLDARWVRVWLAGSDPHIKSAAGAERGVEPGAEPGWQVDPARPADPTSGSDPVLTRELVHAGERVGVIELGPRRTGVYSPHELELLDRIARQAAPAVANVRLTARLAEQLAELTASRVRLVAAQDDERRRIERDLHDGIQQNVVAFIAGLRLARNRLDRGALRPAELTELQDQARETLADLRELAHGIHPQVLTDNGLVAAVESRASRFPIPLTIIADDAVRRDRWDPDAEAVAFYTIREALANVAKHADATGVRVGIGAGDGTLRVEVCDDGHGFDGATPRGGPGGLTNIRDRIAAVGGRLTIDSDPAFGTRLRADLPVAPREPLDA